MELLQENLGFKFKKARKRIKMGSEDEESEDDEREGGRGTELPNIDQVNPFLPFLAHTLFGHTWRG